MPRLVIDGRLIEMSDQQFEALATGAPTPDPLPSFERRILWRICENGTSTSVTTIAAEEWQGWHDPVTAVTVSWAIELLNRQGLVTYRLSEWGEGEKQFVHIRPTTAAYEALGYPPPVTILMGRYRHRSGEVSMRPGDRTDFRNLFDIAIGGPIERDTLENHLRKYPDHITIHPTKEELMNHTLNREANGLPTEPMDIVQMTIDQIARDRGVSARTAYTLRRQAMAEIESYGASEGLRTQVLDVLTRHGKQNDIEAIQHHLLGHHRPIDISKAIWSLQKSGDVTFYERKRGGDSFLSMIKLARGVRSKVDQPTPKKRHPVGRDMTDAKWHRNTAEGGPIESTKVTTPEPEVIENPYQSADVDRNAQWAEGRYASPEPLAQNMKPVIDEGFKSPKDSVREAEVVQEAYTGETDTPTQYPGLDTPREYPELADELMHSYPLISAILTKHVQAKSYESAAAVLEGVDPDMALTLLDKVRLTDLEKEVISFVQSRGT